jgi:hypothetical protein
MKDDILSHAPLPYVVVISTVEDEDSRPVLSTHYVDAYSLIEAMLQVTCANDGGYRAEGSKTTVVSIGPNMSEFYRQLAERQKVGA